MNNFLHFARPAEPELALVAADGPLQDVHGLLSAQLARSGILLVCEHLAPPILTRMVAPVPETLPEVSCVVLPDLPTVKPTDAATGAVPQEKYVGTPPFNTSWSRLTEAVSPTSAVAQSTLSGQAPTALRFQRCCPLPCIKHILHTCKPLSRQPRQRQARPREIPKRLAGRFQRSCFRRSPRVAITRRRGSGARMRSMRWIFGRARRRGNALCGLI